MTEFLARLFVRSRMLLAALLIGITAAAVWGHLPRSEERDEPAPSRSAPREPARPQPPPGAPPAQPTSTGAAPAAAQSPPQPTPPPPPQSPPQRGARDRVESEFNLTRADCLLIVESDRLFTPLVVDAVRTMVTDLQSLDVVDSIVWIGDVPPLNIFGLPDPLLPPRGSTPERLVEARQRALEHPLVAGQLLSDDGRALQLLIQFDWVYVTRDDSGSDEILKAARASLDGSLGADADDVTLQMTGRIPLWKAERQAFSSDHRKYQLIAYSMILLLALLLFRGLMPVFIVAVAPALSVFWTFGLLKLFGREPNDLTSVVMPVLIAMVSFTDGVHLMIHIRRRRADGLSPVDSAASSIRLVGIPCFLTSFTTAVGFASLMLARSEYIHDFGFDCAVGVTLGFFVCVTLIPLLSSTSLGRRLASRYEDEFIGRNLNRFSPAIDRLLAHPRLVSGIGIAGTAGLLLYALQLRPDEKWEYAMPTGAPAYKALAWCDKAFGGIEFAHVTVRWNEASPPAPGEILTTLREVRTLVAQEPLLKHPLSLADLLDQFPSDTDDPETLMTYVDLLPPPLRDLLYDRNDRSAKVLMRCQDKGIRLYAPVFERVEARLAELGRRRPQFTYVLEGGPVSRARDLYQIVVDLSSSLGSAALIIFVTLGIVYRSWRLGLIAVVPNVLPLAATGVFLIWGGYDLNIAAVCAFTVCLGIAVDDTIHFLSRFQEELEIDRDVRAAVRRTWMTIGAALLTTTLVLVAGFATVLGSQMPSHRIFAGMAVSTIGTAVIGDLFLLPAMLIAFYRERRPPVRPHVPAPPPPPLTTAANELSLRVPS